MTATTSDILEIRRPEAAGGARRRQQGVLHLLDDLGRGVGPALPLVGLDEQQDPRPAVEASASPYLHLQGCTPGFEYPRRALPGGPNAPNSSRARVVLRDSPVRLRSHCRS